MARPRYVFPLIRWLSAPLTDGLLKTPITPNQISIAAIFFGLAASGALLIGDRSGDLLAAALLIAAYVLDNCDGEVARAKRMTSRLGIILDDVGDWLVHTAFFAALGMRGAAETGEDLWWWLGLAAAAGGTINYAIVQFVKLNGSPAHHTPEDKWPAKDASLLAWFVFIFRDQFREDFCFIVLLLALAEWLVWLLPFAAVGAQVYWISFIALKMRG